MKLRKLLALCLTLCMVLSMAPIGTFAAETVATDLTFEKLEGDHYGLELDTDAASGGMTGLETFHDSDLVKVIIVMEEESVMEQDASAQVNDETLEQVEALEAAQADVVAQIETDVLEGQALEVDYNYTWLLNGVSAEIPYGKISQIKTVDGVKDVLLQRTYTLCENDTVMPLTSNDGVMIGREDTWANGYSGEGLVIAVIDTGLDTDHPNFQALDESVEVALTAENISETLASGMLNAQIGYPDLSLSDVYVNSKVVFGFNYADMNTNFTHDLDTQGDHGTHVSGIAAANKVEGSDVVGVAPDAQLMAMKVFGLSGQGAGDGAILAALEDAKLLGADVINLSLGSPAGFTTSQYNLVNMDPYFDLIAESNVVLSISAGNNYNSGYGNTWGTNQNLTSDPDNGVLGAPGLYSNVLSVASVENVAYPALYIDVDGYKLGYTDTATGYGHDSLTSLTEQYGVVAVPGAGDVTDYEGLDVTGKVALVQRGTLSFVEKCANAEAAGAVACIVYNNTSGEFGMDMTDTTSRIPCVSVTMAGGEYIIAALAENPELTISFPTELADLENVNAFAMSEFSSWGPAPELTLEPDITAPGGNIYSTTNNGTYGVMSGTSMAAPNLAGISALVMEYVRENFDSASTDYRQMVRDLLMSTSEPLVHAGSGVTYSPRSQGSGLANAFNAVSTQAYLTVDGSDTAKVELGDDSGRTGSYEYAFNVHNFGDGIMFYSLDTTVQTEGVTSYGEGLDFMSGTPVALTADTAADSDSMILTHDVNDDGVAGSHDAYWIYQAVQGSPMDENWQDVSFRYDTTVNEAVDTDDVQAYLEALVGNESEADLDDRVLAVEAGETAVVNVNVTLSGEDKAYLDQYFVNGGYVEGYTYLTARNTGAVSLSLPYLGFYGDWAEPDVLDQEVYFWDALNEGTMGSQYFHVLAVDLDGEPFYAGANMYVEEAMDPAHISVSPNGDSLFDFVSDIYLSTMRNAREMTVTYTDVNTGDVYFDKTYHNISKSYYVMSNGVMTPSIYSWYEDSMFDMTGLANNTELDVKVELLGMDADDTPESVSFPVTVDLEAPELLGAKISEDAQTGQKFLELTFRDNVSTAVVGMMNGSSTVEFFREAVEDVPEDENGYQNYTVTYDVTDVTSNKVILVLGDYALNESYYGLNLNGAGNAYDDLVAFQYDYSTGVNSWVAFGEGVDMDETGIFSSDVNFVAAEYVNGYVIGQTEDGKLYGFAYADLLADSLDLEETYITTLENVYQDFAYNYSDGKLYGLYIYEDSWGVSTYINSINLNGEYYDEENWMTVAPFQEDWLTQRDNLCGLTLACDDQGVMYVMGMSYEEVENEETGEWEMVESDAQLWKFYPQESYGYVSYRSALVGETGMTMDYLQSMTWDHNSEKLYWARFDAAGMFSMEAQLVEVDHETGACTVVGTLSGETCALFAPLTAESAALEAHSNVPDMDSSVVGTPVLRDATVTMNVGGMKTLACDFDPWYTEYKELVWSSDNTDVVTVDENGTITAVGAGSAVVTAANKADESKLDTVSVQVSALDLKLEGIISAQNAGVGAVTGTSTYAFEMVNGASTFGTVNAVTAAEDLNYGLSLGASAMGRGSIWACEWATTGMIYEIDPATGAVKDVIQPVDGDVMFGLAYSETLDSFTGIMNYHLYVDQPLTHWAEGQILNSYDDNEHAFMWRRVNMLPYLQEAGGGFVTGETGQGASSEIVFCGVTVIEGGIKDSYGETYYYDTYKDYLGNWAWSGSVNYQPTQTLVLLDNVGRLWYIDEVAGLTKTSDEWGNAFYTDAEGVNSIEFYGEMRNGTFDVEIVDEDGNVTCSFFNIRQIVETPLTKMYREDSMPRITYHFSDIAFAGYTAEGDPIYAMSLYDYWNNGTTNELYLFVPGHETEEMDSETWEYIRTPDRLFHLGNTGEYNIIATIHSAEVTGGLESDSDAEAAAFHALTVGAFTK